MPICGNRFHALQLACFALFSLLLVGAQTNPSRPSAAAPGAEYSGMYSFLRDGEFVQLTIEDQGRVIGFVSRYAKPDSEGGFLDHFFKSGKLEGNRLEFVTATVQSVGFEFRGAVQRGEGKSRGDEAYYVLQGVLVENSTDSAKKTTSRSSEVTLKSFPQDLAPPQAEKK
jgi:hypothetical protein